MMTTYYEPSCVDYDEAGTAFSQILNGFPCRPFVVGRCALVDGPSLSSRPEYADAQAICGIWRGSKGKSATMEKKLIRWSRKCLPDLCKNQKEGGGPQSNELEHLVYVVIW